LGGRDAKFCVSTNNIFRSPILPLDRLGVSGLEKLREEEANPDPPVQRGREWFINGLMRASVPTIV
jgi:hypothetical protein